MTASELIVELLRSIPEPDDEPGVRADFFRRKATTFEAIAKESDDPHQITQALALAKQARMQSETYEANQKPASRRQRFIADTPSAKS